MTNDHDTRKKRRETQFNEVRDRQVAMKQMERLYNQPLAVRIAAGLAIIFRWGKKVN